MIKPLFLSSALHNSTRLFISAWEFILETIKLDSCKMQELSLSKTWKLNRCFKSNNSTSHLYGVNAFEIRSTTSSGVIGSPFMLLLNLTPNAMLRGPGIKLKWISNRSYPGSTGAFCYTIFWLSIFLKRYFNENFIYIFLHNKAYTETITAPERPQNDRTCQSFCNAK